MTKEFKVGDDVWTMANGWVTVDVISNGDYAVGVNDVWYTKDGKLHEYDKHPTLLDHDPINGTLPPKRVEYIDYLGVRIPKPESEHPEYNKRVFYRDGKGFLEFIYWREQDWQKEIFKYGIWLDEELAREAIEKINSVLEINK